MPIKLMVIFVLMAISVPILVDSYDTCKSNMELEQMESESKRIANAITSVYYSSNGSEKVIRTNLPTGCSLVLGGDDKDAYAIHMYRGSTKISDFWMEKPILSFSEKITLNGNETISITTNGKEIKVKYL